MQDERFVVAISDRKKNWGAAAEVKYRNSNNNAQQK